MVPTKRFGYFVAGFTMYAPAAGPTSLPNPPAIPSAENPLAIDLSKREGRGHKRIRRLCAQNPLAAVFEHQC